MKNYKGFTLLEVLMVLGILSLIAFTTIPLIIAPREVAEIEKIKVEMNQLLNSLLSIVEYSESNGKMISIDGIANYQSPYFKNDDSLVQYLKINNISIPDYLSVEIMYNIDIKNYLVISVSYPGYNNEVIRNNNIAAKSIWDSISSSSNKVDSNGYLWSHINSSKEIDNNIVYFDYIELKSNLYNINNDLHNECTITTLKNALR